MKVGSTTFDYEIDGFGRRIQNKINGKLANTYVYMDQLRLVGIIGADGKVFQRFIYSTKSHVPDYFVMKGEMYRIITDHLGSVRLVVKVSDGSIVQELMHDEFGRVLKSTAPGFQPFGFAGGLVDPNTNLVQFGACWCDPQIGRWLSKDPIKFEGNSTNLFSYTNNDPVNFIDKSGLVGQRPMPGIPDGGGPDDNIDGGGSVGAGPGSTVYVSPNGQAVVAPSGSTVSTARTGNGLKIDLPNNGGQIRLMEPVEGLSPNGYGTV